jgi:hypothetical protein
MNAFNKIFNLVSANLSWPLLNSLTVNKSSIALLIHNFSLIATRSTPKYVLKIKKLLISKLRVDDDDDCAHHTGQATN